MQHPNMMMIGPPMMAQTGPPVSMNREPYPPCEPVVSNACCLSCFCCCFDCLIAKDNWGTLESFYDTRKRGQKREADNVCCIMCITLFLGVHCIGTWWQREKLAQAMGYTPPPMILDLVCSCFCGCFTFEQDVE